MLLEPLTKLHIDFIAATIANDENPEYDGPLIEIITDEHIKEAFRRYLIGEEGFSEDLLPHALEMYREAEEYERAAKKIGMALLSSLIPGMALGGRWSGGF